LGKKSKEIDSLESDQERGIETLTLEGERTERFELT
jgi:hypothetical protein